MSDHLTCPTCHTVIDPTERCPSERGMGRCMELTGHDGWHWTQLGPGELLIWTGLFSRHSCPERLSLSRWCQKAPGHDGPHNDGRGTSWLPEDPADQPTEVAGVDIDQLADPCNCPADAATHYGTCVFTGPRAGREVAGDGQP